MKKQHTLIITGANGFIGSHLTRTALENGFKVVAVMRQSADLTRIRSLLGNVDLIECCFKDTETIEQIRSSENIKTWIECGWQGVAGANRNDTAQISENISRIVNNVEMASYLGCGTWIGLGSQAEYGNPNCKISETQLPAPTTIYGMAKLASCWAGMGMAKALGIRQVWLRIFSVYGPGDHEHWLIPYVIRKLLERQPIELTKGEQLWDYLYVEDAAKAILSCVVSENAEGIYNLGCGSSVPLKEVVQKICEICKAKDAPQYGAIPYRPDQVMHLESDITRIMEDTGWVPTTSMENGLNRVVEQMLKKDHYED